VSYTTFTVTVSNPGSGNRYYIDGALQATVPLAYGATYRFDQSDSSNSNHPLRFSITSDGTHNSGTEYTTGVTYVGTPGYAGAYTQFVVTEVGPPSSMYYYCSNHSGMGGAASLTSNSWGGLSWGNGAWGDQGHIDVSVTGVSLTSTIGNETHVIDHQVTAVGQQLTSTQGSAIGGTSVVVSVTGNLESIGVGSVIQRTGQGFAVSGSQLTSSSGAVTIDDTTLTGEGWGRDAWGSFAWGDNFSIQVTGIQLTSSIGEETAFTDVTASVTGQQLTASFSHPSFSIQIDQDVFVLASEDQLDALTSSASFPVVTDVDVSVTGVQATMSVGNAVGGLKTPVDVTGIQATMTLGTIALEQTTIEPVTGQQLTMTLGQHADIPGQIIGVGGQQLTSSIGSVTATGTSVIEPTGIQMTASVGSVNVTAWAEVNPGVNNIWSVVDRAA
jgi:hypothetical protein